MTAATWSATDRAGVYTVQRGRGDVDGAIDAYGTLRDRDFFGRPRCVSEPRSAGYAPFGQLINLDPDLACDLAKAVRALGKSPRGAARRAVELLRAAVPKKKEGKT